MRVITVDNGNTNPHVGIFEEGKLTQVIPLRDFKSLPGDFIIASDVGRPLHLKLSVDLKAKRHTLANPYFLEMPVHYSETLGDDRLICGHYVYKKYSSQKERVLLIDAGTFITMDIIDQAGFQGGFIFPGVSTFLSAYHKGSQLPVLPDRDISSRDLPRTTEEAILEAKNIYLASILEATVKKTSPSKILVTGGAGEKVEAKLRELNLKVPLVRDPHLIHSALFLIQESLPHQA